MRLETIRKPAKRATELPVQCRNLSPASRASFSILAFVPSDESLGYYRSCARGLFSFALTCSTGFPDDQLLRCPAF